MIKSCHGILKGPQCPLHWRRLFHSPHTGVAVVKFAFAPFASVVISVTSWFFDEVTDDVTPLTMHCPILYERHAVICERKLWPGWFQRYGPFSVVCFAESKQTQTVSVGYLAGRFGTRKWTHFKATLIHIRLEAKKVLHPQKISNGTGFVWRIHHRK